MRTLMVLTSHDKLGETGAKTGFWLEELAAPYYVFKDAGADVSLASPLGGLPPLDPKSDDSESQTESTRRFKNDPTAQRVLANTMKLQDASMSNYDAVFYPGGHGPMWDLAEDAWSMSLIESAFAGGKIVGAVCHAPSVLIHVKDRDGNAFLQGKNVTGFTNSEEAAVGLTKIVPFLLEDLLKAVGANFSRGPDWEPYVVTDGLLVTGQNPASSGPAAEALLARRLVSPPPLEAVSP